MGVDEGSSSRNRFTRSVVRWYQRAVIRRLEYQEGGSHKFWEVRVKGSVVQVTFGRVGTQGQVREKVLGSAAEARAHAEEQARAKLDKGYVEKKTATKKTATKKTARSGAASVGAVCGAIEELFDSLRATEIPGLHIRQERLAPQSASALSSLETKLDLVIPDDLRAFLSRGLRHGGGAMENGERFVSLGFDFMDARGIVRTTQMLRKIAGGDDDEHAALLAQGIALTSEEPQLVSSGGAVYHFSFRNPVLRVADSFQQFLAHYLASGCFCSHEFGLAWPIVKDYVPDGFGIPPSRNVWLKAYEEQFPSFF